MHVPPISHVPGGYKVAGKVFKYKGAGRGRDANYADQKRARREAQTEAETVARALYD